MQRQPLQLPGPLRLQLIAHRPGQLKSGGRDGRGSCRCLRLCLRVTSKVPRLLAQLRLYPALLLQLQPPRPPRLQPRWLFLPLLLGAAVPSGR